MKTESPHRSASSPVLVVDDDPSYRAFVTDAMTRAGFGVHQVSTGADAIEFARNVLPAAVILDVVLPGATGYEICHELRDEHGEDLPIVFVSGERTEPADRVAGLLVGADDYLLKPFDPDELIVRVRRLIAKSTVGPKASSREAPHWDLTGRETEVLRLLAEGLDQNAIARRLVISRTTVGTHIQRILAKMAVHNRAQAVALAYRERLIEHGEVS
jgi:two-component system nitrate/nitrite response regulator NarL